MPLERTTKRRLLALGIVVGTWYAANLAIPLVEGDHVPALRSHALVGFWAHALSVCEGHETFGDLTSVVYQYYRIHFWNRAELKSTTPFVIFVSFVVKS